VLKERLQAEYGLPVSFEMSRFSVCRWISSQLSPDRARTIRRVAPADLNLLAVRNT
jgi:peptide chain release factor 3